MERARSAALQVQQLFNNILGPQTMKSSQKKVLLNQKGIYQVPKMNIQDTHS